MKVRRDFGADEDCEPVIVPRNDKSLVAVAPERAALARTPGRNITRDANRRRGCITVSPALPDPTAPRPLPSAVAPGAPWSDMTKTGDTFYLNEMLDNVLRSDDGFLRTAPIS